MTEPVVGVERSVLPSLTALRWWAAVLVFLYHVGSVGLDWSPLHPAVFGYSGVAFFFVLSGFVLTFSADPGVSVGEFYRRRFARIYPAHLVVLVVLAVAATTTTAAVVETGVVAGLANVVLLQAWFPGPDVVGQWGVVAWSLSAEAFFYACFPLLLRRLTGCGHRSRGFVVAGALLAGLVVTVGLRMVFGESGAYTASYNPLVRLPEFLLGMVLALGVADRRRGQGRAARGGRGRGQGAALLGCGVLAVLAWRGLPEYYPLADYLLLPGFAWLVVACAEADLAGRGWRVLHHRVSVYLGELSFAFYLVHLAVILFTVYLAGWTHPFGLAAGVLPLVVLLALSTVAAFALHHLVEDPARRWLLHPSRWPRDDTSAPR